MEYITAFIIGGKRMMNVFVGYSFFRTEFSEATKEVLN